MSDEKEPTWQELASSQDYERDAPGAPYRPTAEDMAQRIKDATDDVKLHAELARLRAEVEGLRKVAEMVVEEYYGDEGSGDWQTIARAARAALRGGVAG